MRIVENDLLTIAGPDDWTRVRSPSRARRRLKYGHRQNIVATVLPDPKFYEVNGTIYCHPVMARKLRDAANEKAALLGRDFEAQFLGALR